MKMEYWKPSVEAGFEISSFGNVRKNGIPVPQWQLNSGYVQTQFSNNKKHSVHRLVALAFLQNPENLPCVNHKDGDKLNNNVENLEWCTYSQNTIHAYRNGLLSKVGERHHNARFCVKDIVDIRERRNRGSLIKDIANIYKVRHQTISAICNRKTWTHV